MRQIKFRGLDQERNEWVYGYVNRFGERAFIIEPGRPGIPEQHIEVLEKTIGQFTGLIDKNGKEIYESDLVKNQHDKIAKVVWNQDRYGWDFQWHKFPGFETMHEWEIIGNFYENPELLKL